MTLTRNVIKEIQISPRKKLVLTLDWCKGCGVCMELCPQDVLGTEEVTRKVYVMAPEKCTGCGLCELNCPDYVFSIEELAESEGIR